MLQDEDYFDCQTFEAWCRSSLFTWVGTDVLLLPSQTAFRGLQSSTDGVPLEHYTLCEGAEVMALAPVHDICRKELLQSSGILSSLQWWLMAPQILPGSQGVPTSRFLGELVFPVFTRAHTRHLVILNSEVG